MIEYLGLFYDFAKNIKNYLAWREEPKLVDREWLDRSGFGELMKNQGYKLYWSKPEKVESRKLDDYEVIYEIDKSNRVRRRIERGMERLILIGKKEYS